MVKLDDFLSLTGLANEMQQRIHVIQLSLDLQQVWWRPALPTQSLPASADGSTNALPQIQLAALTQGMLPKFL